MNHLNYLILLLAVGNGITLPARQSVTCTADYIVIGVGTAGGVVTEMLTADKKTSVIALHNGKNLTDDPLIKFSRFSGFTALAGVLGFPPFAQSGETTPQQDAEFRRLIWALSLPEGGGSAINAGAYCRETNEVNRKWQAIAGPEWSPKRITQLYKELETYHGKTTNPKARGSKGPIDIRQVVHPGQVSKKFTEAIIAATGVPFVLDYNDPKTPIGASSQLQYTQSGPKGDLRVSSATAFLDESVVTPDGHGVNGRKLRIFFQAPALKTLWRGKTARGVEFLYKGKRRKAFAKKGVVVCAGLKSSTFLMHSGIGPKPLLESLNIPVIFDNNNVGKNLLNQFILPLIFSSNPRDTKKLIGEENGIFAQISWLPDPTGDTKSRALRLSTVNPIPGITLGFFDILQPKSRGEIVINSNDPLADPVINLGTLTNPDDLELYKRGMKTYIKQINAAFQTIDPTYKLIFPTDAIIDNDAELTTYIKTLLASAQHYQGHCRMAPLSQGGVVNSFGRVHGVKGLFVADNSIFPETMDGSPMATGFLAAANITPMIQAQS